MPRTAVHGVTAAVTLPAKTKTNENTACDWTVHVCACGYRGKAMRHVWMDPMQSQTITSLRSTPSFVGFIQCTKHKTHAS